jgi:hypothetical protein
MSGLVILARDVYPAGASATAKGDTNATAGQCSRSLCSTSAAVVAAWFGIAAGGA